MPSKHISSIVGDTEHHVSFHFETIQELIEYERFLQENTFEKYQQDQEIAQKAVSDFIDNINVSVSHYAIPDDIRPEDIDKQAKSRPWVIDWEKVEEDFGPEYKWFAVDRNGSRWVYNCLIHPEGDQFTNVNDRDLSSARVRRACDEHILQEGSIQWDTSLVQKPE